VTHDRKQREQRKRRAEQRHVPVEAALLCAPKGSVGDSPERMEEHSGRKEGRRDHQGPSVSTGTVPSVSAPGAAHADVPEAGVAEGGSVEAVATVDDDAPAGE
jgi:hypothetical protein